MDRIEVRDLRVHAVVGVLPREREVPQEVRIDLTLWTDTRAAAASDDLADTVDYAALAERVAERTRGLRALLIERLAGELALLCLEDPRVERARVAVRKPSALTAAGWVGVTVERARGG
jgi:FolB domain-containing protein